MLSIPTLHRWWHDLWAPVPGAEQVPPLLTAAVALGLPARDADNVREMMEYTEWHLAFDIIVVQLFEYAIPLTADFYEQVEVCAKSMEMAPAKYSILLLLVKEVN